MGVITKKHRRNSNRTKKLRGGFTVPDTHIFFIMSRLFLDRNGHPYNHKNLDDITKKRMKKVFKRMQDAMDEITYRKLFEILQKEKSELTELDKKFVIDHVKITNKSTGNKNKLFVNAYIGVQAELSDKYNLRANTAKFGVTTKLKGTILTDMSRYGRHRAVSSDSDKVSPEYTKYKTPTMAASTVARPVRASRTVKQRTPEPVGSSTPKSVHSSPDLFRIEPDAAVATTAKSTRATRTVAAPTRATRVRPEPQGMSGVGSLPDTSEQVKAEFNKLVPQIISTVRQTVDEVITTYINKPSSGSQPRVVEEDLLGIDFSQPQYVPTKGTIAQPPPRAPTPQQLQNPTPRPRSPPEEEDVFAGML